MDDGAETELPDIPGIVFSKGYQQVELGQAGFHPDIAIQSFRPKRACLQMPVGTAPAWGCGLLDGGNERNGIDLPLLGYRLQAGGYFYRRGWYAIDRFWVWRYGMRWFWVRWCWV